MSHEIDCTLLNGFSKLVEANIDLDSLLEATELEIPDAEHKSRLRVVDGIKVGVAMDEAFCFYYPENLEVLREFGAEIVPFSPLRDSLPDADAYYLGGGYPELYSEQLAENASLRARRFGTLYPMLMLITSVAATRSFIQNSSRKTHLYGRRLRLRFSVGRRSMQNAAACFTVLNNLKVETCSAYSKVPQSSQSGFRLWAMSMRSQ
jgi:hypothetical protein